MKPSSTRVSALALCALVGGAIAVPLAATPASATPVAERQFFVADTDGDGVYGLYWQTSPTGTPTKVFELPTADVSDLTSSADGSRVAYVEDTYSTSGTPLRQQVVVRDVSSRQVRVVEDIPASDSTFDVRPALSPDGSHVAWARVTLSSAGIALSTRTAPVGAGAATVLVSGYAVAAYADAGTVLVQDLNGVTSAVPAGGGSVTATSGIPAFADDVTVSADGTQIAWSLDASTSASVTVADVQVAPFTPGTATAGTPVTLASSQNNYAPAFSRSGSTVYFVHNDGAGGLGDLWSAPSNGGTPAAATAPTAQADEDDVAVTATDDGTVPGDPTALAATLLGTSATVRWTLPGDADLSGVLVTRALGTTTQKTVYVPAPLTQLTDTGLALGSTYTYTFTTVDRSGNLGTTPATHQLTAVQALPTFSDPTSTGSSKTWFPVRFAAGAVPSSVRFDVSYRIGGYAWTVWVSNQPGAVRFFGTAATATQSATRSTAGSNNQFRVTARDGFGNSTPTAVSGWAVVPWDQTKASFNTGTTYALSSAYLGSYRVLRTSGALARIAVNGNRLQVIGARCPGCGVFDVYVGTTRIGTVDTHRSSTLQRSVLFTKTWSTGYRVVTIRARGTAGRPNVVLDGFGIRYLA